MRNTTSFALAVVLLIVSAQATAALIDYSEDFSTAGSESVFVAQTSGVTVTRVASGSEDYLSIYLDNDPDEDPEDYNYDQNYGAYTYGPGKTNLPATMELQQSVDIYIDPSAQTSGQDTVWTM